MKHIYILIITALLLATGWFIIFGSPTSEIFNTGDLGNPTSSSIKLNVGEVALETDANAGVEITTFQKQALEIIDRPVVFSREFPPEIETDLKNQISDVYSSIRVSYNSLDLWNNLGQLRKVIGDYEGAKEAWEFGSLIRPNNSLTFHNLGDLYGLYLNNMKKAEENYLKSVANNFGNIAGYINLAELYWNTNSPEYQDKIPNFLSGGLEKNIEVDNMVPLLARLAKYYSDIGDNDKAIEYYEEILALSPNTANIVQPEIDRLRNE